MPKRLFVLHTHVLTIVEYFLRGSMVVAYLQPSHRVRARFGKGLGFKIVARAGSKFRISRALEP